MARTSLETLIRLALLRLWDTSEADPTRKAQRWRCHVVRGTIHNDLGWKRYTVQSLQDVGRRIAKGKGRDAEVSERVPSRNVSRLNDDLVCSYNDGAFTVWKLPKLRGGNVSDD